MTKLTPPNWKEARRFVELITGKPDPVVCIQVFDDKAKDDFLGEHRHGRLSDKAMQKWIIVMAKRGCGIYLTINETDGSGRSRANVTKTRACAVDLDKTTLPKKFPLVPSIIVQSSPGRHWLFFVIDPTDDLNAWADCQARLAKYYGGDPRIIDPPRVCRLPGFDHQKADPFRSRIIEANEFERYTLAEVADAHPCDYNAPAERAEGGRSDEPEAGWDSDGDLQHAKAYLESVEPPTEGDRNNAAYCIACALNDFAISPETSFELMTEVWNPRLDGPLPDHEIRHVIKSSGRYKHSSAGSKSLIDAADDFDDEFDFEGDDRAKAEFDFESQTILKLNDVTAKNIFGLFRVVNLNGKMRVVWWARSALDPNVRTPQFWSIAEFKTALINKFCIRTAKKTNAKGEETESTIRIPLSHYFLSSPKRYTFDGVVLNPELHSDSPDAINLWRGYGFEENESGDWSLMREHIRKVIANGKQDRFDYIVKWIAWALQNPASPCEVALILKSATHGTGKGMVLRTIRKLFGAHAMQISKGGLLTGRFNAHLAMTCFLFVDEMTLADNKESATLNSTLTEDAIPIEPKGIDAYMMPNHVKVAAASNQEHVVLIAGSDRRFMIFEVGDQHARDIPYFKAMTDQLEQGGYGRMLHDLLAMDLDGWHPRNTANCSDDKDPEKIESAPPEVQWLAGYLDSGVLDCQVEHRDGRIVRAGDFYERARRSTRGLSIWTDNRFAAFMKGWNVKRRISHGAQWEFPPLADMRSAFVARYPWWPAFDSAADEWHDATVVDPDDFG
jgi:hypothetical protein